MSKRDIHSVFINLVMKTFLLLTFSVCNLITGIAQSKSNYLLVGTYNGDKSQGIYVYRFKSATGDFDSVNMIKTNNPSFLDISPGQKFVYAVHEIAQGGNGGEIAAFSFDKKSGALTFINQQLSGGDHPCYVAVDKTGQWVAAANYTSGSLSILPVNKKGGLDPASTIVQHVGSSVNDPLSAESNQSSFADFHAFNLSNVTVCFLPPNTTSHIQPLDAGIIKSFKSKYKQHYCRHLLLQVENEIDPER